MMIGDAAVSKAYANPLVRWQRDRILAMRVRDPKPKRAAEL
jgi:hypothetical protein